MFEAAVSNSMPRDPPPTLSAAAETAWRQSVFGRWPDRAQAMLRETSLEVEAEAGQIVHREAPSAPVVLTLVASGLVRVYVSSPHGREVTVRYARQGEITGLPGAIACGTRHGVQAITRCHLVMVQSAVLRHLARTDAQVAWTVCEALKDVVFEVTDHLTSSVFRSVTERVASALVELGHEEAGVWVVDVSQQQLADSIGSVREVVARSLRQLQAADMVAREESRIVVRDVTALRCLVGTADPAAATPVGAS
jgi:CRP/FNR family cyclic AMP-dependent transcriptional regulator